MSKIKPKPVRPVLYKRRLSAIGNVTLLIDTELSTFHYKTDSQFMCYLPVKDNE